MHHDHTHTAPSATGDSYALAVVVFVLMAELEWIVAFVTSDGVDRLLYADALHNLADAAAIGGSGLWLWWLQRRNAQNNRVPNLVLGWLSPIAYATGLELHHGHSNPQPDARSVSAGVAIGLIAIAANWLCHLDLHSEGSHGHEGLKAHLLGDMCGGGAVIMAALLSPFTSSLNNAIASITLMVITCVTYRELHHRH